jgi:hypothetical protein
MAMFAPDQEKAIQEFLFCVGIAGAVITGISLITSLLLKTNELTKNGSMPYP